jgi:hypothetical protein
MDCVVTVPQRLWLPWLEEGDLPGEDCPIDSTYGWHFWIRHPLPKIRPGERVYIVAHGRLRGYSPLIEVEPICTVRPARACLVRYGNANAVTIPTPIQGFRGWRYRWWAVEEEIPFPAWQTEGIGETQQGTLF